jgi:hypothetical protein
VEDPLVEDFKALRRKLFDWRSECRAAVCGGSAFCRCRYLQS